VLTAQKLEQFAGKGHT